MEKIKSYKTKSSIRDDLANNLLIRGVKFRLTDEHKAKILDALPALDPSDVFWAAVQEDIEIYLNAIAFAERNPIALVDAWKKARADCVADAEKIVASVKALPPAAFKLGKYKQEALDHAKSLVEILRRQLSYEEVHKEQNNEKSAKPLKQVKKRRPKEFLAASLIERLAEAWARHTGKGISRSGNKGEFPDFCEVVLRTILPEFPISRIDSALKTMLSSGKN